MFGLLFRAARTNYKVGIIGFVNKSGVAVK